MWGCVCVEVVLSDTAHFCDVMCATHIDFIARFFAIHFDILVIILQSFSFLPSFYTSFFTFWPIRPVPKKEVATFAIYFSSSNFSVTRATFWSVELFVTTR